MKKIFLRGVSAILCIAMAAAVLFSVTAADKTPGDINKDGEVDNKDVVSLFRHLSGDKSEVDERACDTNADGEVDNKDVVALFRHVSDPTYAIFYGKEDDASDEETTEEITDPEETTDPGEETETEETTGEPEEPDEDDNIFRTWDDSVKDLFTDLRSTEISIKDNGIALKYTAASTGNPRFNINVAEYARIKEKRTLTGADASFVVIKIKSNTDGDLRLYGSKPSGGSKLVSYKPDGEYHYIIMDMTTTKAISDEYLSTMRIEWATSKAQAGSEAFIKEIGFFTTLDDALDYCAVIAGTQSGIVRDGTPKKYVTMSFDDATQQDLRVIQILKKYGITKATFFINTGLCGVDWTVNVSQMLGKEVEHKRFTMAELKTGIYDGYDLECHTLNHPSMKQYDNNPEMVKKELITDAINIFNLTGIYPAGLAWPGSSAEQTNTTRKLVYENTNLRFARGTTFQYTKFNPPKEFLIWEPTCSMSNSGCLNYFKRFLKKECTEDMLFYGFAHGFEFDANNSWDVFEEFIKAVSEAEDVILVTNAEFYQLFKDEIPAYIPAE